MFRFASSTAIGLFVLCCQLWSEENAEIPKVATIATVDISRVNQEIGSDRATMYVADEETKVAIRAILKEKDRIRKEVLAHDVVENDDKMLMQDNQNLDQKLSFIMQMSRSSRNVDINFVVQDYIRNNLSMHYPLVAMENGGYNYGIGRNGGFIYSKVTYIDITDVIINGIKAKTF